MTSKTPKHGLPKRFVEFKKDYPEVFEASERLGMAIRDAGTFDPKTTELLRLAIAVGARTEGGVHSHVRRALEAGATPAEVRHVILLAISGVGFPVAMAAMSWVDDVIEK